MNTDNGYMAIVFDLFGTLVSPFLSRAHDLVLVNMAIVLGVESDTFEQLFDDDMRTAREMGKFSTIEENIEVACQQLGVKPQFDSVHKAAEYRYEFMERSMLPRNDAIQTINQIKARGYRIGLISDCSPEVPKLWARTPFAKLIDVPVFSCEVGIKKPNRRIYQRLCDRLEVEPQECLYVGDGDSFELEGASDVGMDTILFRVEGEEEHDRDRPLANMWQGKRISALREILDYV